MALIPYAGKHRKGDGVDYDEPGKGFANRAPRQAELLSYLQGLAPVGETFIFNRHEAVKDLDFGTPMSIYHRLRTLIKAGIVAQRRDGTFPKLAVYVVLKRLESLG